MGWNGRGYKLGSRVRRRSGVVYVKVEGEKGEGKMIAEHRRIWELTHEPLKPGDRVFKISANKADNSPGNLAMIHFNQTKYVFLENGKPLMKSRVLESWEKAWGTSIIRTISKKTKRVLVNS